jgi:hypothetical protein
MSPVQYKKVITAGLTVLLLSSPFANLASALTITGIRSLNNETRELDYKLSHGDFTSLADRVPTTTDRREILPSTGERLLADFTDPEVTDPVSGGKYLIPDERFKDLTTPISEREVAWLVENNILSRDGTLTYDNGKAVITDIEDLFAEIGSGSEISRTDFLMGIYKAIYGPINSRPLVFSGDSYRVAGEEYIYYIEVENEEGELVRVPRIGYREPFTYQNVSDGKFKFTPVGAEAPLVAEFPDGDKHLYVSPNVPELYLKELLDKRVIELSQLIDTNFQEAYKALGKAEGMLTVAPRWYNQLPPFEVGSSDTSSTGYSYLGSTNPLGKGYDISSTYPWSIKPHPTPTSSEYFINESLDSITALKYVEALLRLTEKDMTDTEARIVTYKYGATYLDKLDESDRRTVMFLTAKGVLNFEDPTEYRNLYSSLTTEFAYKLFYRLANKEARLNFSEIQLTDSDNFWLSAGFSQVNITMNYLDESAGFDLKNSRGEYPFLPVPDIETISVERVDTVAINTELQQISMLGFSMFKAPSMFSSVTDPTQDYLVEKSFDNGEKYKYKGTRISELTAGSGGVEKVTPTAGGKVTVQFRIMSSSPIMALATIDSNIQIGTDYLFQSSGISAVSKIDSGGKQVTLVPSSMFRDNNPALGQKIMILEDKVLKNTETGTTAVLLKEKNMALIGTHVITGKDLMVEAINGEVFYNLEVIRSLLSNAYISAIDSNSIYVTSGILNERVATVIGDKGKDNPIGKTYVAQFEAPHARSDDPSASAETELTGFVNISQLDTASNFLIKNFDVKNSNEEWVSFKVIMQLVYRMPDKDLAFLNPVYENGNPNFKDVNSFIYERPSDPELADWWDNNFSLSNAFANEIYGTKGIVYVKSGYLVPNITILYNQKDDVEVSHMAQFFQRVGSHLPDSWVKRFIGDSLSDYNLIVSGTRGSSITDPNNQGQAYYPSKSIPAEMFPKWVHVMFNNVYQPPSDTFTGMPYMPDIPGLNTEPVERKNTELWRYLMSSRSLSYESAKSIGSAVSLFTGGSQIYAVTKGDAVYLKAGEDDAKFPTSILVGDQLKDVRKSDWTSSEDFWVKISSRTENENKLLWVGRHVSDPTKTLTFYVKGVSGNKLQLVENTEVRGTPVVSRKGDKVFYDIKGTVMYPNGTVSAPRDKAVESRYKEIVNLFTRDNLVGYENSIIPFESAKKVTDFPHRSVSGGKIIYLDLGKTTLDAALDKTYYDQTDGVKHRSFNDVKNSTVSAYVMFELDINLWDITDDGILTPRKTFPFLQVGNIYFSGINKTIMDSILDQYIGVVPVNKLEEGATLQVGEMTFTKRGDTFVSAPQTGLNSWTNVIAKANDPKIVKNGILSALVGMAVINASGNLLPMASFVSDLKLDVPIEGAAVNAVVLGGGQIKDKAYLHSYKAKNYTLKEYSSKNVGSITSVVFSMKLNDDLLARKLDLTDKSYSLMFSTNTLSEGYLDDIPFFAEDLRLDSADDLFLIGQKVKFNPLANATEIRTEFMQMYEGMMRGDIKAVLRLWSVVILSFLIILSWVGFFILKFNLTAGLLDVLKNPGPHSTRKGIDGIKILTVGMFSMDSDISIVKLLVSNLMMFGLIYVLLDVIKW